MTPAASDPPSGKMPHGLLEHATWLRPLARALVRDQDSAEDLMHDALWIAARREHEVRDMRAFLRGTVRRLALKSARSEAQRRWREQRAAAKEALPDTAALVEHVELMKLVLEEIASLPSAQQRAVTLRFLHGLEPSEIAARDGVTASSVRANLAKGLARLRERLDREGDGRAAWCSALAPFAGLRWDAANGVAVDPMTPAGAASGAALFTIGAVSVSTFTTSVVVAAAVLVTWLAVRTGDSDPADARSGSVIEARAAAAETQSRSESTEQREVRGLARTGADDAVPGEASAVAQRSAVAGLVLDANTGEPVPAFDFEIHAGHSVLELVTDSGGAFASFAVIDHGTVLFGHGDPLSVATDAWREESVEFPFDAPLRARIGPTFVLDIDRPSGVELEDLRATLSIEGELDAALVRTAPVPLADGPMPWVRFPYDFGLAETTEQREIVLSDQRGHWRGRAPVARGLGIEPVPVRIELQGTGAIEFEVVGAENEAALAHSVNLRRADGSGDWRRLVWSGAARALAPDESAVRHLEPGVYVWTVPDSSPQPLTGRVEVEAGTTQRVPIAVPSSPGTFDALVRVIAPSEEHDLGGAFVMVTDPEEFGTFFNAQLERDPAAGPRAWRVALDGIPARRWNVFLQAGSEQLAFDPSHVTIAPGTPTEVVRVVDRGPMVRVDIRVLSAVTGEPLPLAEVAHASGGLSFSSPGRAEDAAGFRIRIPLAHETRIQVNAPGHRMQVLEHRPIRDGRTIEVRLEEGWANVVRVLDTTTSNRLAGVSVLVDGEAAGTTGTDGELWLESATAPERIEVRLDGFIQSFPEAPGHAAGDYGSAFGIHFVLRPSVR